MHDPAELEMAIKILGEDLEHARKHPGWRDEKTRDVFRRCASHLTNSEMELIIEFTIRALRGRVIHLRRERRGLELELKRQQESGEA